MTKVKYGVKRGGPPVKTPIPVTNYDGIISLSPKTLGSNSSNRRPSQESYIGDNMPV